MKMPVSDVWQFISSSKNPSPQQERTALLPTDPVPATKLLGADAIPAPQSPQANAFLAGLWNASSQPADPSVSTQQSSPDFDAAKKLSPPGSPNIDAWLRDTEHLARQASPQKKFVQGEDDSVGAVLGYGWNALRSAWAASGSRIDPSRFPRKTGGSTKLAMAVQGMRATSAASSVKSKEPLALRPVGGVGASGGAGAAAKTIEEPFGRAAGGQRGGSTGEVQHLGDGELRAEPAKKIKDGRGLRGAYGICLLFDDVVVDSGLRFLTFVEFLDLGRNINLSQR